MMSGNDNPFKESNPFDDPQDSNPFGESAPKSKSGNRAYNNSLFYDVSASVMPC